MLAAETPPLLELRTLATGGTGDPVLLHEGRPVPLPSRLQQRLLLRVGCAGGQLVSRDDLVQTLWPVRPPRTARELLSSHVARLRRVLSSCTPAAAAALPRSEDGYRVDPELLRVDVVELARAVQLGDGRADLVLAALQRLPAVSGDAELAEQDWWARAHRLGWEHVRELCRLLLEHPDGSIRADVPWAELVPTLQRLAEHSPYDEPVVAWLVEGLALTGRSAVALQTVADTRERLAEELGADPSPPLREAYDLALTTSTEPAGDPGTAGSGTAGSAPAGSAPAGSGVPRPPLDLVGRERLLTDLAGRLTGAGPEPVRLLLVGAPGVGTSALAAAVAARVSDRFTGGVRHVDLAGPAAGREVPGVAWAAGSEVPGEGPVLWLVDHLEADKRLPRVPAADHLLVTGTAGHPDLLTADVVGVAALGPAGSRAVLRIGVTASRLRAEPAALAELVGLCGGRPGALRRAAGRLVADPVLTLAALVALWRDPVVRWQEVGQGPDGLAASWDRALAALEPWVAECLAAVATSGPVDVDRLAEVMGTSPDRVAAGGRILLGRGLLRGGLGQGGLGRGGLGRGARAEWWVEELLAEHLRQRHPRLG